MKQKQRTQVVSNAKYLRSVRPIDPDEIFEYVDGQPHPAVVRQVLREHAVELGIVEAGDGTFVPASDDPISTTFHGVKAFPAAYAERLEDRIVGQYGPGWPNGEGGDVLRHTIRKLKEDYFAQNPVEYDEVAALAYAVYHLPDYYASTQYVFADMLRHGLVSEHTRILDVGAGTGGPALGIHDLFPEDALVDYHALEPSESADIFEHMLAETRDTFRTTVHRETAEDFQPSETYDVVLFSNVLSELEDPVSVVRKYEKHLADDGSIVAIAPADRNTSIGLRQVERTVEDGLSVWGPAVRIWPGFKPEDEGWSFDVKPDLEVPPFQAQLDRAGGGYGEFENVDVQYSWTVLRTDDKQRLDIDPNINLYARMNEMEKHVTKRIDLLAVKLSHSLSDGDSHQLFRIGDGSERIDHYAVRTKETSLNAPLADADYGDLLIFENVLVLWNDDEEAYNLVVDGKTTVDSMPA
ncbi:MULTISPECIES: small ribosomal subunit Rsm22 family protein [unclassified Haladaptatus]|uniref:small ribosomal subunit Rsm22 family protein n=1 Tax=unclassified Haladaptatus TaxID=2622732 RepID=UPI0023E79B3A|nr:MULTISPECIES: class I SAM-dependent methyltransferase [unclassified Haladaptatus]